jgi:hypothetical protein
MKIVLPLLLAVLVASPSMVQAQRVKDNLLAFYDFEEGSGTTVNDTSDFGEPLNLTIHDPTAVKWGTGSLALEFETIVSSASAPNVAPEGTATKLYDAIGGDSGSGAITIEAWITPQNLDVNGGPARIVTMSVDPSNRNFTLGQNLETYQARFRTTTAGNNGSTIRRETDGGVDTLLQHVVYTRDPSGDAFIYLDGEESPLLANAQSSDPITGDATNWNDNYDFAIGNELSWTDPAERDFLGDFHMVAIYGRALTGEEANEHFSLGKDAVQSKLTPGDFNDDGILDAVDFNILADNFGTGTSFFQGDSNGDGTVDLFDYVEFRDAFNAVQGQLAAVPEPTAFSLLLTSLLLLPLRRMSRPR